MIKKIKEFFSNVVRDGIASIPYKTNYEIIHTLFAQISTDGLKRLIKEIEDDPKKKGYIDYISLAELYALSIRENLEKRNNDIIHNYYELLPKLNEYKKAFDPLIIEEIEKRFDREKISGVNVFNKKP